MSATMDSQFFEFLMEFGIMKSDLSNMVNISDKSAKKIVEASKTLPEDGFGEYMKYISNSSGTDVATYNRNIMFSNGIGTLDLSGNYSNIDYIVAQCADISTEHMITASTSSGTTVLMQARNVSNGELANTSILVSILVIGKKAK